MWDAVFFSILDGIKNYPSSPPTFYKPFPASNWTFQIKLSSHGSGKQVNCNFLCRNPKRYVIFSLLLTNYANGCYLFYLNQKLPDLTFINKFLIVISILFALNFNYRVGVLL